MPKPKQAERVLIILANGEVHEGHFLKNANYKEKNINRWRIYKTGKTVADEEVLAWIRMKDIEQMYNAPWPTGRPKTDHLPPQLKKGVNIYYNIET